MATKPRSRTIALVLSLVPGWGHVYWGREAAGTRFFTGFAIAGCALFNGLFVYLGPWRGAVVFVSFLLLSAVCIASWINILRWTSPRKVEEAERAQLEVLRAGTIEFLRGDLRRAAELFQGRLKTHPMDVEALFRLGIVHARLGETRLARSCLRRAQRFDFEEKWRWEVEQELSSLSARARPTAVGALSSPVESARKRD